MRPQSLRLSIFILLCAGFTARAQRFPFYNLGVEDGLVQSQATCMAQAADGTLWIGTLGGLSSWDGQHFTNYSVRDGLLSNTIYALTFDSAGNLWIGSSKGLTAYNGRKMQHFGLPPKETPGAVAVTAVAPAPSGGTWCVAGPRLYHVSTSVVNVVPAPGSGMISAIFPAADGNLWLARAGSGRVYRFSGKVWDSLEVAVPADRKRVVVTAFTAAGARLFVSGNMGLYFLDAGGTSFRPYSPWLSAVHGDVDPIFHLCTGPNGGVWAATAAGVWNFPPAGAPKLFNRRAGLTDNAVRYTLRDREGNIWLATDGKGIFRFSGAPFSALDESTGLPSGQVMGLAEAADGTIFVGTYDAGLYASRNGSILPVPFPDKSTPTIGNLAVTGDNDLWIGTRGDGLWRRTGNTFKHLTTEADGLSSPFVSALSVDNQGRLWSGFSNGASLLENGRLRRLRLANPSIVQDFLQLSGDTMLLCTGSGLRLYSISADRDFPFRTGTAADSATVQCLAAGARRPSEIWMGTGDNGVIVYDRIGDSAVVINRTAGLRSEFIYNLLSDAQGAVWAGTGNGIYRITHTGKGYQVDAYGKDQGVVGIESNHRAAIRSADGSLWFGTTEGAVHYVPGSATVTPAPGPVVITGVRLYGETISDTTAYDSLSAWSGVPQGLRLGYRQNNLSFSFRAASLTSGGVVLYRYRIDGIEPVWSEWSPTNTVTYSALPPGNHRLRVQCATEKRVPLQETSYRFTIITPFHQTWAFRLLLAGAVLLAGVGIQYYAARRRIARRRLIEALRSEENAKVRQRTAEDFHDEVGNKLTRINVLTNVLSAKVAGAHPDAQRLLSGIQDAASQLYSGTRDILWSLAPSNDSLYSILQRIEQIGQELFADTAVRFEQGELNEAWKKVRLPMDQSRNLLMVFKEALNNALKHSGATLVQFEAAEAEGEQMRISLQDNGSGFEPGRSGTGNGLNNMKLRAQRLDGSMETISAPGQGTRLVLRFKIPQERG